MGQKAKTWVLQNKCVGKPKTTDIVLKTEELPDIKDGEILIEAVYLTVDPYMRIWMNEGDVMPGEQIARVIQSKNSKYPCGAMVRLTSGWRSHTIISDVTNIDRMPELDNLPYSLVLGIMGMPGMTAYFGVEDICKPKPGETFLVNAAAGAVGSVVGQIGKIKGANVIGCAGSDEKCKWLKNELGFDEVFNYKTVDLEQALTKHAPNGIDCYFDNVGNDFTTVVLKHMNKNGRVAICGQISGYNDLNPPTGPYPYMDILVKNLTVKGFFGWSYSEQWEKGEKEVLRWIKEGKLKYKESVTDGFDNMAKAFMDLFEGKNTGKAIIRA